VKELIEYLSLRHDLQKIDHTKIRALYVHLDEARFFLPDGVRKFLEELHQACEEFLAILAEREILSTDDDVKWRSTAETASVKQAKLREIYSQLPRKFEEALAFKQFEQG